jgi:CRISPR-associated protein Cas2
LAYLVCYDIADDTRRDQVSRVLLDYGERVQESVFWLEVDSELRDRMIHRLKKVLSEAADLLWVVPACNRCVSSITTFGARRVPDAPTFYVL